MENKHSLLKFITCGSVDDGKSTLIGRLLFDAHLVFKDQLDALTSQKDNFALLLDGLKAEREQNITIDVAYRYFSTKKRKFVVIDCPGHEQYTHNMVTGASNAQFAVLLIDASKGLTEQTLRHIAIVHMMGIQDVMIAINKMDLVNYAQSTFNHIKSDFLSKLRNHTFHTIEFIPLSALKGENIIELSKKMKWYHGDSFLSYIEKIEPSSNDETRDQSLFMPVQLIMKSSNTRYYCGKIAKGTLSCGDSVYVMPSRNLTKIAHIYSPNKEITTAKAGNNVCVCFEKEIDASRGDFLCKSIEEPPISNSFNSDVIWMSNEPLHLDKGYLFISNCLTTTATITNYNQCGIIGKQHNSMSHTVKKNELIKCKISTSAPVAYFTFNRCSRGLGGFILVDRATNDTVACGMMTELINNGSIIFSQSFSITKTMRSEMKLQKPCIFWLTGLPSSGKSTIANQLENELFVRGKHTFVLDGDNIRLGINKDLSHSEKDRQENIRRIAEIAKLFVNAGIIVIVAAISPYESERNFARSLVDADEFIEIYVSTPIAECERRDVKGLYKKAKMHEIIGFTGVDAPYEIPTRPELVIDTQMVSLQESVDRILNYYAKICNNE